MIKELLIFGSNGALGTGVTEVLTKKDFNKIYLFDFKFDSESKDDRIKQSVIQDMSIEENVSKAFTNIQTAKEKHFFLFSTIGGFHGGVPLWETEVNDFDKMININLKTNYLIAKHFSRLVQNSAGGSICFTSAYVGNHPEQNKSGYGASKAALSHMVKSFAEEGKKIKLSVNAIAPYIIDTEANRNRMKKADYDDMMKPAEIGELVSSIFYNFNFVSGNIIELKLRFNL